MSDPAWGSAAIDIIIGSVVAVFGSIGGFFAIFRTSKTRIYERFDKTDKHVEKQLELIEQRAHENLARVELQLSNRIALLGTHFNDVTDVMSDRVHDLEEKSNAHAVQLGMQSTTQANIEATLGRLEGMITIGANLKTDQFDKLMEAIRLLKP